MIRLGSGNRDEAEKIMGNSVLSILLILPILEAIIAFSFIFIFIIFSLKKSITKII
jgi:hypothetical protein